MELWASSMEQKTRTASMSSSGSEGRESSVMVWDKVLAAG